MKGEFKFIHPETIRVTIDELDYVFVNGETYKDLPKNGYLKSLLAQGYFEKVTNPKTKI